MHMDASASGPLGQGRSHCDEVLLSRALGGQFAGERRMLSHFAELSVREGQQTYLCKHTACRRALANGIAQRGHVRQGQRLAAVDELREHSSMSRCVVGPELKIMR